jgi:hypothetical protein
MSPFSFFWPQARGDSMPSFQQVAVDTFQRPNENPLNAANWQVLPTLSGSLNLQVTSTLCENTMNNTAAAEGFINASFNADQYAEVTLAHLSVSAVGPIVRASTSGFNYYLCQASGTFGGACAITLYKFVAGVRSAISFINLGLNSGDRIRVSVIGTTFLCFQNEVAVLGPTNDASLATGVPGCSVQNVNTLGDAALSGWSAGNAFTNWSEPDCRTNPNSSREVQGTLIYDVTAVDSRNDIPVDSRAAGAPVDSRTTPNIPFNSRKAPS